MTPRLLAPLAMFVLLAGACDKKDDAKKAEEKAPAKKADDKKAEANPKPEEARPDEGTKETEVHFDVSADKSGALVSSTAAVREHLAGMSHHAENITSDETLCKHMMEIREKEEQPAGNLESCVIHFEHEVVVLGPEVFAQMAQCVMDAKTAAEIDACEAAEKEAEAALHANAHGDGLTEEQCEELFNHFEKLSMEDAGEHAEFVKGVLEEVRPDALTACQEQGTKAEHECAMAAETMDVLSECQTMI